MDDEYTTPPFKGGRKWVTQPDQRGKMLMWVHPDVLELVSSKAAQRGETLIAIGAHMYLLEPGENSVYVMPNAELANSMAKIVEHWQKSVSFVGDRLMADPEKRQDKRNTIKQRLYKTCAQYFFSAAAAGGTAEYSATFATNDEAERTPGDPKNQGSVWAGFDGRFQGQQKKGRKRIFSTRLTPDGIITELMDECEHVFNCQLPCPLCGDYSVLRWGEKEDEWGIRFDEEGKPEERAETVRHVCRYCGDGWTQDQYDDVIEDCRWVSESGYWFDDSDDGDFKRRIDGSNDLGCKKFNPDDFEVVAAPYRVGIEHTDDGAGLYGVSDWVKAVRQCIVYTASANNGNDNHIKRFINEFRAKAYAPKDVREVETSELLDRREEYEFPIPRDVQFLVCGIDFGLTYSEYEIVGYGNDMECFPIQRRRIDGDADNHESRMYTEVDEMLLAQHKRGHDGKLLPITLTIMDGRYAQSGVRNLASKDPDRRIVVYGDGKSDPRKPLFQYDPDKPEKSWHSIGFENGAEVGCFEVTINPHEASRQLYAKVAIPKGKPGYYHVPDTEDYGKLWANAFTSDKKQEKDGRVFYGKDHSGIRGEAHDTGKYCYIAGVSSIEYAYFTLDEMYDPYRNRTITRPDTPAPSTESALTMDDL